MTTQIGVLSILYVFSGSNATLEIIKSIVELLGPVNATTFLDAADGLDVSYWIKEGVPGGSILNRNNDYFWYHHSDGMCVDSVFVYVVRHVKALTALDMFSNCQSQVFSLNISIK